MEGPGANGTGVRVTKKDKVGVNRPSSSASAIGLGPRDQLSSPLGPAGLGGAGRGSSLYWAGTIQAGRSLAIGGSVVLGNCRSLRRKVASHASATAASKPPSLPASPGRSNENPRSPWMRVGGVNGSTLGRPALRQGQDQRVQRLPARHVPGRQGRHDLPGRLLAGQGPRLASARWERQAECPPMAGLECGRSNRYGRAGAGPPGDAPGCPAVILAGRMRGVGASRQTYKRKFMKRPALKKAGSHWLLDDGPHWGGPRRGSGPPDRRPRAPSPTHPLAA